MSDSTKAHDDDEVPPEVIAEFEAALEEEARRYHAELLRLLTGDGTIVPGYGA